MQSRRRRIIHAGAFPKFSFCNDKVDDDRRCRAECLSLPLSLQAYVNAHLIASLYFYEHVEARRYISLRDASRGRFPLSRNSSRQCLSSAVVEGVVDLGDPIQRGHIYFCARARTRTSESATRQRFPTPIIDHAYLNFAA